MAKRVYTGLASEFNGKPIAYGDTVELSDEQVAVLRNQGHSFMDDVPDEQRPTPQEVDAAFVAAIGEADLSKAGDTKKK